MPPRALGLVPCLLLLSAVAATADERVVSEDDLVRAARRIEESVVRLRTARGRVISPDGTAVPGAVLIDLASGGRLTGKRYVLDRSSGRTDAWGFFAGDGTAVLTTASAVDGATEVQVVRADSTSEATVVALDRDFDVALLRTSVAGKPLEIDAESELEPGRALVVPGAAADGEGIDLLVVSSRATTGYGRGLARLARTLPATALGAPALGPDGRVRGLVVGASLPPAERRDPLLAPEVLFSPGDVVPPAAYEALTSYAGRRNAGPPVAHLVPGRRLARAAADLLAHGRVRKSYLGLVLGGEDSYRRVARVLPGSPAEGKVQAGDVVVAVGRRRLDPWDDVFHEILALEPGEATFLTVRRGEEEIAVDVVPTERRDDAAARGTRAFGFEVVALTPELKAWVGTTEDGVLVSAVAPGTSAERAGLRKGDRVLRLAERDVRNLEDAAAAADEALRRLAASRPVTIEVVRDGSTLALTLG